MNSDPLAQLRDIHLPPEPGLPWAFLVIAFAAALLVMLIGGAIVAMRRRPAGIKAEALKQLEEAQKLPSDESLLAQAKLLRRLARSLSGGDSVGLQGREWLHHLDKLFATDFFTSGGGRIFGDALYRAPQDGQPGDVAASLRQLIGSLKC